MSVLKQTGAATPNKTETLTLHTYQKEKAFQRANNNILSFTNEFIENHMTDVMIEPLKRDLAKAGIKMELIKDLDYELVTKKEIKQLSF